MRASVPALDPSSLLAVAEGPRVIALASSLLTVSVTLLLQALLKRTFPPDESAKRRSLSNAVLAFSETFPLQPTDAWLRPPAPSSSEPLPEDDLEDVDQTSNSDGDEVAAATRLSPIRIESNVVLSGGQEAQLWDVAASGLAASGSLPSQDARRGRSSRGKGVYSWLGSFPQWHLQGLASDGRTSLLTNTLAALSRILHDMPVSIQHLPPASLRAVALAVTALAAFQGTEAMLGYVPALLRQEAATALAAARIALEKPQKNRGAATASAARARTPGPSGTEDSEAAGVAPAAVSVPPPRSGAAVVAAQALSWIQQVMDDTGVLAVDTRVADNDEGYAAASVGQGADPDEDAESRVTSILFAEASSKAVVHTMLLKCIVMLREDAAAARREPRGGDAVVAGPLSGADDWASATRQASLVYYLRHSPALVQDVVIAAAEASTAAYMVDVRSGAMLRSCTLAGTCPSSTEGQIPAFMQPRLMSTRSLERFRNHVMLSRWARLNYLDVVDIYEDRYTLLGFTNGSELITRRMFSRRTRELNALKGWNDWLSTALEFADVISPVLAGLAAKFSSLVSFFLVGLIGRGLGLVYKGIRQSISSGRLNSTAASRKKRKPKPDAGDAYSGNMYLGFV